MSLRLKKLNLSLFIFFFLVTLISPIYSVENRPNHPQSRYVFNNPNSRRYNIYSSDEKRFAWFRVYKVASGSMKDLLLADTSDLIQSHPKTCPRKFKNYFKFSFVRNPWDRIVSCYFHKVATEHATDFAECFGKDFDYFVDFINRLDVAHTNPHIQLQTRLIPVKDLDFIGKLDNFAEDLKYVCDVIGVKCDLVPHKHKTDHIHYSAYYTPRTRDIIARKYKEDIEAFGFTFEEKE